MERLAIRNADFGFPEHPKPIAPARGPPQTELLTRGPPSPYKLGSDTQHGHAPFDQRVPVDDGTWSA